MHPRGNNALGRSAMEKRAQDAPVPVTTWKLSPLECSELSNSYIMQFIVHYCTQCSISYIPTSTPSYNWATDAESPMLFTS